MTDRGDEPGDQGIDLRALFGPDFDDPWLTESNPAAAGSEVPEPSDIPEDDQQLLRGMLAAEVASPPPATFGAGDVVAAARRDRMVAAGDADELAARRRRRIRGGLLAAAAVAAVLAIGIPLINSGGGVSNNAGDSAGYAGSVGAQSGSGAEGGAAVEVPSEAPESDAAAGTDTSSAAASADAGGSSAAASGGDDQSRSAAAGPQAAETSAAAGTAASAGSEAGREAPGRPLASTSAHAPAATSGGSKSGSPSRAGSGAVDSAGAASCAWPELPATLDAAATRSFGPGVVGIRTALTAQCRPTRLGGAVLPAADGSRGGVTVQILQAARAGDCLGDDVGDCRQIGADSYAAAVDGTRIVWVYRDALQIRVSATVGLGLADRALVDFAGEIAGLVR